jgi:glycosyltransferase involved in cell wall biosynthesis/transposase
VWKVLKSEELNTVSLRNGHLASFGEKLLMPTSSIEKSVMIKRFEAGESVIQICRDFRVSRTTFYKWLARYKQAGVDMKSSALESQRAKAQAHWRYAADARSIVKDVVVAHPEFSAKQIKAFLVLEKKTSLSASGIYKVLKELNLNTYEKRLAYVNLQTKDSSAINQVIDWELPATTRYSYNSSLSPPATGLKKWQLFALLAGFSFVFSSILFFLFTLFAHVQSSIVVIGLVFALISFTFGMFFFFYSLKYFITIAIVLSFSRADNLEEGRVGSFFERLFGFSLRVENEDGSTGPHIARKAIGLQANLSDVRLERHPFVSIHVSTFNEKRVIDRLLTAVTSMDYDNYEVIVADDSNDETVELLEQWKSHPRIKISHRENRDGYKGQALALALTKVDPRTEFILIFDADFIPYPDSITQFLKYFKVSAGTLDFSSDVRSNIAAVQGYQWHVLNKSENWITRGVRSEYSGSYVIERSGAEAYGGLKQISGSVYMVRRDVVEQIGWGRSITEDFEFTLKLYERGYKVVYTPYVQAPAEAASTIKRLIRQRMRWAEGHSYNIKKMLGRLLFGSKGEGNVFRPSPLSLAERFEVLYLTPYYLQAAFFMIGTFAWFLAEVVFRTRLPFWTEVWGWSLVFTNLFALPLMNLVGLFMEESEEKDYLGLFSFIALSYIVAPFQAYAAVKGFLEKEEGPWFRTPKTGRITDTFMPGRLSRFVRGVFGMPSPVDAMSKMASSWFTPGSQSAFLPVNPYVGLGTANNQFNTSYKEYRRRGWKWTGKGIVASMLIVVMLLNYMAFFPQSHKADAAWYDNGYTYKKAITINHAKVTGETPASTVKFMESGTDATHDMSFWTSSDPNYSSSDCTVAETGSCSVKLNSGNPGTYALLHQANVAADSGTRISFYMKFDSFTTDGNQGIIELWDSTDSNYVFDPVALNSSHQLCINGICGATVLSTGVWYRISLAYTITSTSVNQFKVFLNGNLEVNDVNDAVSQTGSNYIRIGLIATGDGNNVIQHMDDVYIDNGSDLSDPGDIHVTNKRPNANGASNQFTTQIGSGGSGYGSGHSPQVNEQPLSTTNGWSTSVATQRENYTLENASTGDVNVSSKTLIADEAWAYAKTGATCSGEAITNNGNDTSIALTTSYAMYTNIRTSTSYPSSSSGVGLQSCTNTSTISLAEAGMLIGYYASTNLSNFPLLVSMTDPDLKTTGNGGHVTNSNGYDIVFTDSTETTKLDHEIEKYNASSGEIEMWVRIPSLSMVTDTTIYMYFGDSSITTSQENKTGVWDSNYKAVYHAGESSGATTLADSTSDAYTATKTSSTQPAAATGKIDGAQSYASGDKAQTSSSVANVNFGANQDFTVGTWVKTSQASVNGAYPGIVEKEDWNQGTRQGWNMILHNSDTNAHWKFEVWTGGSDYETFASSDIADGNWHHLVAVRSGATMTLYQDGSPVTVNAVSAGSVQQSIGLAIGNGNVSPLVGTIDETEISNTARNQVWIAAEYNNQSSPSTFYSVSSLSTNSTNPTIEQQVNIIDQTYTTASTTDAPADNSLGLVNWDGTKYSGDGVYFEAVLKNDGTHTSTATLYSSGGSSVSSSGVSTTSSSYTRVRSSALTLTNGTDYSVRLNTTSGGSASIIAARLIVVQTSATLISDTSTQVEVGDNETTTSSSLASLSNPKLYKYDDSKYSPSPTAYFEATLKVSGTASTSAGFNFPSSGADNSGVGSLTWSNPGNITASDANNATVTTSSTTVSHYLIGSSFGFSIPSNATVTGITATMNKYQSGGSSGNVRDSRVRLVKAGTVQTIDKAKTGTNWVTTTTSTTAYGSGSDLWGGSWTPSDINNSGFGVALAVAGSASGANKVANVNWMEIQVAYTLPAATNAELYNATTGALVATSAITTSSTSWTRVRSSSLVGDVNWRTVNPDTYYVEISTTGFGTTGSIANAHIVLNQSQSGGITNTEMVDTYVNQPDMPSSSSYASQSYLNQFNPSNWVGGAFSYSLASTMKTSSGTGYAQLYNNSDSSAVSSSEVTTTAGADSLIQSGSLTMPSSAKDMDTQLKSSTSSTVTKDTSTSTSGTSVSSLTISNFTVANNSNRLLLVGVSTTTSATTVSSVTYGGTNLTLLQSLNCSTSTACHDELWYLKNPTAGTANIVVSYSATGNSTVGAASLYNVNPYTTFGTVATNTNSSSPSSLSVTSTTNQLVVDSFAAQGLATWAVNASQTQLWLNNNVNTSTGGGSYKSGSAGSTSMSWTGGTDFWADIGVGVTQSTPTTVESSELIIDVSSLTTPEHVWFLFPLLFFLPYVIRRRRRGQPIFPTVAEITCRSMKSLVVQAYEKSRGCRGLGGR